MFMLRPTHQQYQSVTERPQRLVLGYTLYKDICSFQNYTEFRTRESDQHTIITICWCGTLRLLL